MTEAAPKDDYRRAWLDEDVATLSAARVAKHRLVEQVRRLVDAAFQLDAGDSEYGEYGEYGAAVPEDGGAVDADASDADASDADASDADASDADRAARFMALATDAEELADRLGSLPRIPRAEVDGMNSSLARRYDALLVERSTVNGRGNPLAPPVRMWADGDVIRGEAYFTAPYEGPAGRTHGAWVAACFDEILGCAQGASGTFGYTGTLTITMRRATPLYTKITYEAGFSHREGRKIQCWGRCYADGVLTAEATGVFVTPALGGIGHGTTL